MGTRPEIIKFAPVIRALGDHPQLTTKTLLTGQQADLVPSFLASEGITPDYAYELMQPGADFTAFLHHAYTTLLPVLATLSPRLVVVQGDTSTAYLGATMAAFHHIDVLHIEAGLRSGDVTSPYPEETLRTLITHCASLHCAPTERNAENLLAEGVNTAAIAVTGNPIVDAVERYRPFRHYPPALTALLAETEGRRRVVLTLHRRENFGQRMGEYLGHIRAFADACANVVIVCPVHPNPNVQQPMADILGDHPGIRLVAPMDYHEFLSLVAASDLVLSDSGGIQEETATLGVPLYILRTVTERPEILQTGLAALVAQPADLGRRLAQIAAEGAWPERQRRVDNPFGDGCSGVRIAQLIRDYLA